VPPELATGDKGIGGPVPQSVEGRIVFCTTARGSSAQLQLWVGTVLAAT
jgi:hypothetical protein